MEQVHNSFQKNYLSCAKLKSYCSNQTVIHGAAHRPMSRARASGAVGNRATCETRVVENPFQSILSTSRSEDGTTRQFPTPPVQNIYPPERAEQIVRIANDALNRSSGTAVELEKALGMLMLGDYMGWRVLVIIHNKRTMGKYEDILGISVREFFPEEGPVAMRSLGYSIATELGNFWKVVSGDISVEDRRELAGTNGNKG
jgi:hypothetical protein